MVNGKALQPADIDGIVNHAAPAVDFTGVFADIAADTGKGIVLTNEGDSLVIALFPDKGNIARDIHMGWADRDAGNRMGESRNAAAAENVLLVVVTEAFDSFKDHDGSLVANGPVRRVCNDFCRPLDAVNGFKCGRAVHDGFNQRCQLAQSNAARYAFPAGLGMAEPQETERHINGTQTGRTGADAPLYIPVEPAQDHFGTGRGLNGQSCHRINLPFEGHGAPPHGCMQGLFPSL